MKEPNTLEASKPIFSRQALTRLIVPLVIEQFLLMTVGMVDIVMVTSTGEAAVSGVSLVDNINTLLIQVFAALATGGAVVVSQYLGRGERESARKAAKQLIYAVVIAGVLLTAFALLLREKLLYLVFGNIPDDVMKSALDYFIITAMAYPFMAVYNAGAALFRSMGNSRVSMFNSAIVNLVNFAVGAPLIYRYHMGSAGSAIGTLVSRIVAAVIILFLLQRADNPLRIEGLWRPEFRLGIVKRILAIGVPNGLENGLFQVGKLIVLSLVTTLGATEVLRTAAIAANGIAGSVSSVVNVPGTAMGLAMVTVVGQCIGAKEIEQAVSYAKKLLGLSYLSVGVLSILLFFFVAPVTAIFGLGSAAASMTEQVLRIFSVFSLLFWPMSFTLPNALRAAGDVLFTMSISLVSMFVFRLGFSYLLAPAALFGHPMLNMGLAGVWLAMCLDWIVRSLVFGVRFLRGKWKRFQVI
jgi:putative MATE family efflux protein